MSVISILIIGHLNEFIYNDEHIAIVEQAKILSKMSSMCRIPPTKYITNSCQSTSDFDSKNKVILPLDRPMNSAKINMMFFQ